MSLERDRPPPFFIIGFQRSGTTLLRMMLDSHPGIAVPLDTVGLWARYEDRLDADFGSLATDADADRLVRALLGEYRIQLWNAGFTYEDVRARVRRTAYPDVIAAFYEAYAAARGKDRWGSKDPGDMRRIDRVDAWFPRARILHIVRDGRDACLSQTRQDFGHDDLLRCGSDWAEQVWWVRRMGRLLGPARYHELRYEDLVLEPERELGAVADFLDVDFHPAMLSYHERVEESIPAEKRHIWPMIDRPPAASRVERWRERLSGGLRICFEKRAGAVLRESGYDVLDSPRGAYATEIAALLRGALRALKLRIR